MANKPTPDKSTFSGFYLIAAWSITALIIVLASKTKIGYTILFFFVCASIIIVLAVGSPTIINIFNTAAPAQQPPVGQAT